MRAFDFMIRERNVVEKAGGFKNSEESRKRTREYQRKRRLDPIVGAALRERRRAYHAANRERIAAQASQWRVRNTEGYLLTVARNRAKKGNIPFNITIEDIKISEFCPALGIKLDRAGAKWADNIPTLDRINPEIGYVKGNVCVISKRANMLKSNGSAEELKRIYEYIISNG